MLKVLYEDNHLIAVYKPAGILAQGDKSGDKSLMDEVKDYLKKKYKKTGKVFLGLLHRLDRNVGGIVLFAKTSKGATRLSEQFRQHSVEKIYQAIVFGSPRKKKDVLTHYLKKDERTNKVTVYDQKRLGAKLAKLSYEVVKSNDQHSLLKIRLETGRSHQIRAQLAAIGHPIVGDVKYGAPESLPDQSIALSATSLTFQLATKPENKTIEIELSENWKFF